MNIMLTIQLGIELCYNIKAETNVLINILLDMIPYFEKREQGVLRNNLSNGIIRIKQLPHKTHHQTHF